MSKSVIKIRFVRVMNKKFNTPQTLTVKTYESIQTNQPKLAADLEFLYECDKDGNKIEEKEEVPEVETVSKESEKEASELKASKSKKSKHGKKDEAVQGSEIRKEGGTEDNSGGGNGEDQPEQQGGND